MVMMVVVVVLMVVLLPATVRALLPGTPVSWMQTAWWRAMPRHRHRHRQGHGLKELRWETTLLPELPELPELRNGSVAAGNAHL